MPSLEDSILPLYPTAMKGITPPLASYTFTNVNANHSIAVTFALNQYTVTVNIAGSGTVTRNPDQTSYTHGSTVQLQASPSTGWSFSGSSGGLSGSTNPATITMDGDKIVTATFTELVLAATVDVDPDTLNLKSKSDKNAVTVYIELAAGYDVKLIDVSSLMMKVNGFTITAQGSPSSIGDYDKDKLPDLMVKFERQAVINALDGQTGDISITITGQLKDGRSFAGSDTIKVINPGK